MVHTAQDEVLVFTPAPGLRKDYMDQRFLGRSHCSLIRRDFYLYIVFTSPFTIHFQWMWPETQSMTHKRNESLDF